MSLQVEVVSMGTPSPPVPHTHPGGDITSPVANATNADTVDGHHANDFAGVLHSHNGTDIVTPVANATNATNLTGGEGKLGTIRANVGQWILNTTGAYLHLGTWDSSPLGPGSVLVNFARYAESAGAVDWSGIGNRPGYTAQYSVTPSWIGLTGSLNLGNLCYAIIIGNIFVIQGYIGGTGAYSGTYGTTYISWPGINTPGGLIYMANASNGTIYGMGRIRGDRLYFPTFSTSNAWCDWIAITRYE